MLSWSSIDLHFLTQAQSDLFRHFIGNNEEFKRVIEETDQKKSKSKKGGDHRRRRTEQEEDEELLQDEKEGGEDGGTIFTESPSCRLSLFLGVYIESRSTNIVALQTLRVERCETTRLLVSIG